MNTKDYKIKIFYNSPYHSKLFTIDGKTDKTFVDGRESDVFASNAIIEITRTTRDWNTNYRQTGICDGESYTIEISNKNVTRCIEIQNEYPDNFTKFTDVLARIERYAK